MWHKINPFLIREEKKVAMKQETSSKMRGNIGYVTPDNNVINSGNKGGINSKSFLTWNKYILLLLLNINLNFV